MLIHFQALLNTFRELTLKIG